MEITAVHARKTQQNKRGKKLTIALLHFQTEFTTYWLSLSHSQIKKQILSLFLYSVVIQNKGCEVRLSGQNSNSATYQLSDKLITLGLNL